jgi:dihydrodipicolinate synthase/N-acetylneuraminate lyase
LIAATYTPLSIGDGSLHLDLVPAMVDFLEPGGCDGDLHLRQQGGEGMSLSGVERLAVAEAYVQVAPRDG